MGRALPVASQAAQTKVSTSLEVLLAVAASLGFSIILLSFEEYKLELTGILLNTSTIVNGLIFAPTDHSECPFTGFNVQPSSYAEVQLAFVDI